MMRSHETQDRTLPPSERRRRLALQRGEAPRSLLLVRILVLGGAGLAGWWGFAGVAPRVAGVAGALWRSAAGGALGPERLAFVVAGFPGIVLDCLWPLFLAAMVLAAGAHVAQAGLVFAPARVAPDLGRLGPVSGLSRIVGRSMGAAVAVAVLKVVVAFAAAGIALHAARTEVQAWPWAVEPARLSSLFSCCGRCLGAVVLGLLPIGVIDWWLRRRRFEQDLRMTPAEARREMRDQEGDPLVRQEILERARALLASGSPRAGQGDLVLMGDRAAVLLAREVGGVPHVVSRATGPAVSALLLRARRAGLFSWHAPACALDLARNADAGAPIPRRWLDEISEAYAARDRAARGSRE